LGDCSIASASAIKKTLAASDQRRLDIAMARHFWIHRRMPFFCANAHRLVFIDETSTNTKLTKRMGWSPHGERYRTHAPFGSWQTQTFVAGLRHNGLTAPWLVDAPMNAEIFSTYVETQLAPTLAPRDVVILDNVPFHKDPKIEDIVKTCGAWLLFLPAYSPDLNPIEMAFSKLKTLLRKQAARTFDAITEALGDICSLFTPRECGNYFRAVGIEAN
jgi:transposase